MDSTPFIRYRNLKDFILVIPSRKRIIVYFKGYKQTDNIFALPEAFDAKFEALIKSYPYHSAPQKWIKRIPPHTLHEFLLPVQEIN